MGSGTWSELLAPFFVRNRIIIIQVSLACFIGILVLLVGSPSCSAETRIVDVNGNGDYTSLQEAINASSPGDTLKVWAGTYDEQIVVNITLEFIGNGSANTVIDGQGSGNTFTVRADGVNLSGLHIMGGGDHPYAGLNLSTNHSHIFNNTISQNGWNGLYLAQGRNNSLQNNTIVENGWNGMDLRASHFSDIYDNNCSSNYREGIYLNRSHNNTLLRNRANGQLDAVGIYLARSNGNLLQENNCSKNNFTGMVLRYSYNNTLYRNRVDENGNGGVNLYLSSYNWVVWNYAIGNYRPGISLTNSTYNTVGANNCSESPDSTGITLVDSRRNSLINNTLLNNDFHNLYLLRSEWNFLERNQAHGSVDGNGITVLDSSSNGLLNNRASYNSWTGIRINNSARCDIYDNFAQGNENVGIGVVASHNLTIFNNTAWYSQNPNIWLNNSRHITIDSNNASHSRGGSGIYLRDSQHILISRNWCFENKFSGIWLKSSENNHLANNTLQANEGTGLGLDHSNHNWMEFNTLFKAKWGIYLGYSSDNTLANNSLHHHSINGIYAYEGHRNMIEVNQVYNNQKGLVFVNLAANNTIRLNNIFNNTENGVDAGNNNGVDVIADNNWWGHSSGPYHAISHSNGQGDEITIGVTVNHWYGSKVLVAPWAILDNRSTIQTPEGNLVSFSGSGWDPDGLVVAHEWSLEHSGVVLSTEASFTTLNLPVGNHTIRFRVQDNDGVWSQYKKRVLLIDNLRPIAFINSVEPRQIKANESMRFEGTGTELNGQVAEFRWVSDLDGKIGNMSSFTTTKLSQGTHNITLQVKDDDGHWSEPVTVQVTVNEVPDPEPEPKPKDDDSPAPSLVSIIIFLGLLGLLKRRETKR